MKKISTLLIALTFCCFSINSIAQLSFTQSTDNGCAPLAVTFSFTGNDPNSVNAYFYFGDGNSFYFAGNAGFPDTTYTYFNGGNYTPYLYSYDASWNYIESYNGNQITIPGGSYINAPDSACPNEVVYFQNYDNANSWFWDFGDGNTSSNQYAQNTYTTLGNYNVMLILNTSCGNDTLYKTINIGNTLFPNPNFNFYYNNVCPNTPISFYPSYTSASYYWDFEDGFTDTLSSINHSFSSPGIYSVTYTATNGCGNSASKTDSVTIVSVQYFDSTVYIDVDPDSACPNTQINFWAPYSGTSYVWNFNDGSPQDTTTSYYNYHLFSSLGNYNVTVKMFNGCGNDTTYTVTVPIVNTVGFPSGLSASNNSPACPGSSINLQAPNGYAWYVWNYGDGSPQDSVDVNYGSYWYHTYTSLGTYTASVKIYNSCGLDTTLYTTVNITNTEPIPNYISINNNSPACPGGNIYMNLNLNGFNYYLWDYGDGSAIDSVSENNGGWSRYHIYQNLGTYNASVTIYNSCGNDTTLYTTINITNTELIPNYVSISNTSPACPGGSVQLYLNINGFNYYLWDFGDGSAIDSVTENDGGWYRYHIYQNLGTYNASVTIYNSCGNDTTLYTTVKITNTELIPNYVNLSNASPACPGSNVNLQASYGNDWWYVWNYGDGSPSDSIMGNNGGDYRYHIYNSIGTYNASVTIYNSCGNDTILYTTVNITNSEPVPGYVGVSNNSPVCPGNNVGLYTNGGFPSYVWDYGDGSPVDSLDQNGDYRYHVYSAVGSYTASVTIYNSCGNDTTLYTTVNITNSEPVPNYVEIYNNSPACPGGSVQLNLNANGFNYYVWDFGDGSPIESVTENDGGWYRYHTYNTVGTYTASVTIYNNCGNDSTLYTTVDINTNSPFPNWMYYNHYPNPACPNDNINFNAESGYTSYVWNYGDGSPVQTTNDGYSYHPYSGAGGYNASVTITNTCGNDTTLYDSVYVSNYAPFPNGVEVYANNPSLCPGTGNSFYLNYIGAAYSWNFGDGSPVLNNTNNNVYHVFTSLGVKTVSVTVTNNCGNDTTVSTTVNVEYPPFPNPMDVNINTTPACPNQPITFSAPGGYYKYIWTFGDSSAAYVNYGDGYANHSYGNTGTYTVSVKILNNCGADPYQYPNLYKDTTIYTTVVITNNLGFSGAANINAYPGNCSSNYSFNATSGNQSYLWNYGDGETDTTNYYNSSHNYSDTGSFTVSVIITNYCGSDTTVYTTVNIVKVNYGSFTPDWDTTATIVLLANPNLACPEQNIQFYSNDMYGYSYYYQSTIWNFGDGSPLDTNSQNDGTGMGGLYNNHIYSSAGNYSVAVQIFHQCGNDTTVNTTVSIDTTIGFPNGAYFNTTTDPCVSQQAGFYASGGYLSYEWNYGDTTSPVTTTNSNSYHQYSSLGSRTASITITNYCGNDTTLYKTINVVDYKPFDWSYIQANPNNPCPGENVGFYAEAGPDGIQYEWNFDDGTPNVIVNNNDGNCPGCGGGYIQHAYSDTGTFNASVTVTNLCGNDTTIYVTINVVGYKPFPYWTSMNHNPDPACPGDYVFFNSSYGFASYQWNFGDGETGQNYPNVNHTYDSVGTYTAMLTLTNFCGNDTTLSSSVNINGNIEFGPYTPNGEPWYVYSWPNYACPGQNVQMQAPYGLSYYIWDFGDGSIDSTSNFYYMNHKFDTVGTYTVALTMKNNCGSDTTVYTTIYIQDNLGFQYLYMNISPTSACPNQDININGPYGYASYIFDYGDGSPLDSSSSPQGNHSYNSPGTYNVGLKIYNFCGLDTIIYAPVNIDTNVTFTYAPNIFSNPSSTCPGQEVFFSTEGGHKNYLWNFNDGNEASGAYYALHAYDSIGTYNVKVTITNFCGDDTTVSVNVVVSDTISTFPYGIDMDVSPSVSCPGDMVELSTWGGYVSYFWTFGDGDTLSSTGDKVEHIYSAAGNYNASVKITNGCGFSTTIYQTMNINGGAPIDSSLTVDIPFNPNCPGDEVFFNVRNGASTYIYNWNFGDNASDSTVGTGTSHIYSDSGNYTVNLIATNGCGNKDTISLVAEINNSVTPVIESGETFGFGTGQTNGVAGCPGDAVLFWFAGTYDNVWDFGDGSTGIATEQVMSEMGVPLTVIKHIYSGIGTYNVKLTVTNSCGKSITDSMEVEIGGNLLVNGDIFIAPPTGSSGYTTCMSIDMIGTGGASYSWDFGDGDTITTVSPTISHTYSQPGTYTVKLKVKNGCGYSATYFSTITVNGIGGPDVSVASTDASCSGSSDGSATVTVNDGISPFTYQWDVSAGSQTGASANNLAAGTYNVTVTDAIGCASVEIVNVSQPTDMTISSSTTNSTCGASDGGATISVSGGSGSPYTYVWSSGGTTETETGLAAGNYSVTVTNGSGCSKVGNVSVNNGNAATVSVSSSANVSCNGNSDGSVNISVSGGTSPYVYLWNNGVETQNIASLPAGTYSVTVTDDNGCVSGQSITITQPNSLSLSTSVTNANCGTANGSATVNPLGGTTPYSYLWDSNTGNKTTQTASGLFAGSYSATVTDASGCTSTITANISNANAPTITSVVTNVSCNGAGNGSIDLTVTGGTNPYSYNWSTGSNTQDQSNLTPSTYLVIIQDASGCQSIRNFTITQPNILTASATSVAATCGNADGTATVTHSGGNTSFSYLWSNGVQTQNIASLQAGNYSVTVTDNRGCSATASTTVTQPSVFASTVASDSVNCNGGADGSASATTAGGNSPYSYIWSNDSTTSSIFGLPSSVYSVTITDVNSCTSENSVTVSEPNVISASFTIADASCFGGNDGSADVSASGGTSSYTYLWDDGSTTSSLIGLSVSVYYVTITDANNCTLADSADVGEASQLAANFTVSDVACFGNTNGSINLNAGGGTSPYSYLWENSSTNPNRSSLAPATYYVTITDDNGCTHEDSATVGEPQQLSATLSATDMNCNGTCDGTATVSVSGGTSPFTYLWTNGDNSATADSLCSGNYTVNISDGNNCQATQIATIAEPSALSVALSSVGTTCGNSDGTSTAMASGGTMPYSYLWNDAQTDSTATALGTGAISVTVTDNNGCTASATDNIGTYVPPVDVCIVTVDTSSTKNLVVWEKPMVNYIDSFRVYREIIGTYTYLGSVDYLDLSVFSDTTNGVNPQVTSYKYKISAVDNCGNESAMSSYHKTMHLQTIFQQGEVDLSWDDYDGFGTNFFYRILRDSTGTGNWEAVDSVSFGSATQWTDINPPVGNIDYVLEVVHPSGGCLATLKSAENHNSSRSNRGQAANSAPLDATATSTDATQGDCDGTATVTATGGVSPYNYIWDNNAGNQTTETANGLCAGNYNVTVTDANNNTTTASVTVFTSGSTLSASATSTDATQGNCDGTATVTATGGTSPYTYAWSSNANGQTTATITGLCAGSYSVTVTDNDGNPFIATTNVGIVGSSLTATATATNTTDTVNCNGTASAIPSGGTTPYTYLWSDGQTDSTATGLCAGSYTVTVTDGDNNTFVASANVGVTVIPFVLQVSLENAITIYPNPNGGKFQLAIDPRSTVRGQLAITEIRIYNVLGEVVYSFIPSSNNSFIDLSKQGSGIYYIQISTEKGMLTKKVVVE